MLARWGRAWLRRLAASGAISGPIVVGYIIGGIGDAGVFTLGAASFAAAAFIVLILGIETRGRTVEEICRAEEDSAAYPK